MVGTWLDGSGGTLTIFNNNTFETEWDLLVISLPVWSGFWTVDGQSITFEMYDSSGPIKEVYNVKVLSSTKIELIPVNGGKALKAKWKKTNN